MQTHRPALCQKAVTESDRRTPMPSLRRKHDSPQLQGAYLDAHYLCDKATVSVSKYRAFCRYISRSRGICLLGLSHPFRSSHFHSIYWMSFRGRGLASPLLFIFLYLNYYTPFYSSQHRGILDQSPPSTECTSDTPMGAGQRLPRVDCRFFFPSL